MAEEEPTTPSPEIKKNEGDEGKYKGVAAEAEAAAASMALMAEDLQRSVMQSRDSAMRSARILQHNMPGYIDKAASEYRTYERAFFHKIKGNTHPDQLLDSSSSLRIENRLPFCFCLCEIICNLTTMLLLQKE